VVAIPKITTISCEATNPLSGQTITSNSLTLLFKAPAYQLGPFTIRDAINEAGASIGTATYLTVDKFGQLNMLIRGRPFPEIASPVFVHPVLQPFPEVFLRRYTRVLAVFQPFYGRALKHLQRPPEYFAPLELKLD